MRSKIFVNLREINLNKWKITRRSKIKIKKTSMLKKMLRYSDRLMKRELLIKGKSVRLSRKRSAIRRKLKTK